MKSDMNGRRPLTRFATALLTAAVASVVPSFADQIVYFVNGKAIMVKSVEQQGVLTLLEMEGGGRMGVPSEQIARVEEYELSAPVIPAPPVAAQIPVQASPPLVQTTVTQPELATQPSYASVARTPAGPGVTGPPSTGAPPTPMNAAGAAMGRSGRGALAGSGGPYRPGLGAQGRRFGKGIGTAGRMQRGVPQGGFRNPPPTVPDSPASNASDAQTDQQPADPDQDPVDDPNAPPVDDPAAQGGSGS